MLLLWKGKVCLGWKIYFNEILIFWCSWKCFVGKKKKFCKFLWCFGLTEYSWNILVLLLYHFVSYYFQWRKLNRKYFRVNTKQNGKNNVVNIIGVVQIEITRRQNLSYKWKILLLGVEFFLVNRELASTESSEARKEELYTSRKNSHCDWLT